MKSKYEEKLSNLGITHPSEPVESVLSAACSSIGFDIVEMWLRTGPKTHQLIHSHLRYSSLNDTQRSALVDVYYGDNAPNRAHKLSPALCKKARANNNVVWVTSQTYYGAQALKCSLSGVLSAVAVPVCHEESQTNMTVIYFSMKKSVVMPVATEFLIHMSLAASIVCVNLFDRDLLIKAKDDIEGIDEEGISLSEHDHGGEEVGGSEGLAMSSTSGLSATSIVTGSQSLSTATSIMKQQVKSMNQRAELSKNINLTPSQSPGLEFNIHNVDVVDADG